MIMTPEQLIEKWQPILDECKHCPTWTEPASLAYCAEVAAHSTVMVELGSYIGASAMVMLKASPNLHLWTCDHFQAFAFNQEVCAYYLRDFVKQGRCELIKGQSDESARMLEHMRGKIDAVWVDDGHATEDVKRDIRSFLPLLRSGGQIFGHDFDVPHNNVAIGVLESLPPGKVTFPVPRVWSYIKP